MELIHNLLAAQKSAFLPLDPARQLDSRAVRLADHLRKDRGATDGDAAEALGLRSGSATFRKTKHRLQYALLNQLTAIDSSYIRCENDRQEATAAAWKLLAGGMICRSGKLTPSSIELLKTAYATAAKHDVPEVAALAARTLRDHHSNVGFDRKLYRKYREDSQVWTLRDRSLTDIREVVAELNVLRTTTTPPEQITTYLRTALAQLDAQYKTIDYTRTQLYLFYLRIVAEVVAGNPTGVIDLGRAALDYLDGRTDTQPGMYQMIESNLSVAYLQTCDYTEGRRFALRLRGSTTPASYNYIKVYELLILLALRSGNYQDAYTYYREIHAAPVRGKLRDTFAETFGIIEGYLYVLIRSGRIVPAEEDVIFPRFRMGRFLNSFPHASQEKSERNVHLLILRLLDFVIANRHSASFDGVEAIRKYAQRHLRRGSDVRSRAFLNMLTELPRRAYHRAAVERHTQRYLNQLRDNRLTESRLGPYREFVPFEQLWGIVTEHLHNKRALVRS